jgi:hypothetical protein
MANQFMLLAKEVLKQAENPLTFDEIWDYAVVHGIDKKLKTSGKTPWRSLGAQLFVDVRDNPESEFKKAGSRPARFYLKEREKEINVETINILDINENEKSDKTSYKEKDLHPVLTHYVYYILGFITGKQILTKTIHHEKSKKMGLSEWVYPDLVGFYIPINNWSNEVIELNRISDNNVLKLYSFELKKSVNRSNYRESFFQAVSNSSWAHEGYLVTSHLLEDEDLLSELERLNQAFGIGIIVLDLEDIESSKILFPAKPKIKLDWETINKLADANEDYKKFIQDIKIDLESRRIHFSEFDKIEEDINNYIKRINK